MVVNSTFAFDMPFLLVMAHGDTFAVPSDELLFDTIEEARLFVTGYVMPPPTGCTWRLVPATSATRQLPGYRSIETFLGQLKGNEFRVELAMRQHGTGRIVRAFSQEPLLFASVQQAQLLPMLWPPLLHGHSWVCIDTATGSTMPIEGSSCTVLFTVHANDTDAVATWIQNHCQYKKTLWQDGNWVEFECVWDDRLMNVFRLCRQRGWLPTLNDVTVELASTSS